MLITYMPKQEFLFISKTLIILLLVDYITSIKETNMEFNNKSHMVRDMIRCTVVILSLYMKVTLMKMGLCTIWELLE